MVRASCHGGDGQPAQIWRESLPRRGGGLLAHPDRRGVPHEPAPGRDTRSRAALPRYYVPSSTPCFRREKVSAGKDARGIKRVHQFQKVEMVKFVEPSTGREELAVAHPRRGGVCWKGSNLPYRRVAIATGDLSFVAAIKFDLEVWAAGCQEWLEVSSCSLFRDFQARRANIRYRPQRGRAARSMFTRSTAPAWPCRV